MVGQRIGSYRVLRQLGQGGMGVVYEAVRDDIGSRAALKVLRPEFAVNAEAAARFFNEARAANLIEHPGIVKVFDYGQLPTGAAYLAMEFLAGESLHQRIHRLRRIPEADTIRLGRQVAAALAAAHAKQVIHRDLKPDNIFIVADTEAPGGERVKILDFGIAKLTGHLAAVRTHTNMVMGTPIYMSPEQCRGGKNVDERADVYALGVILFEMIAGRPPFVAEEPGEYIGLHLMQAAPPLGSIVPSASPSFQRLVDSMLSKEPQIRPAMLTVAQMLKELGNLSSDVVSVRALVAQQNLDGETQHLLRAGDILKHSPEMRPLLPPLQPPPAPAAVAAPAAPAPAALPGPNGPLNQSPGSDSHTAALPLHTKDLEWAKLKVDPPTLKADAPNLAKAPGNGVVDAGPIHDITKPIDNRPPHTVVARLQHEAKPEARTEAQTEALIEANKNPAKPRLGPEDATAVLGAEQLDKLQTKSHTAALPPDWQPVQLVVAPKAPLDSLDADSAGVSDVEMPRVRSLARRFKRLRFRIKKKLLGLLGITALEPNTGPQASLTMLSRRRSAVLVAILVLAILVCLVVLLAWQPPEHPAQLPSEIAEQLTSAATSRLTL